MDPKEPRVGRRLAALFAADVAGYSRLMGQDEAGTVRALSAARGTLGCLIAEHGGRIANSVGDSMLAEFPSVVDAVKCAIAAQEKLADMEAEATEGPRLPFRIAVHVGDIVPNGADIFGDGINVCARLQEVAEPRGICISGAAYQYVRKVLPVAFDDLGERTLKNIDEPVRVFAIRAAHRIGHSPPQPKHAVASFPASAMAIAVLPFVNMSGDASQEFFSDGMTEEITAALAKIPGLRVVARTSAFRFKGQNPDVRMIGQSLGASHLIEGSVRKAGERVRISAQLIETDNGTHLWTENYDRELTDIFAIQEGIAQAIATALRVPLGLKQGERLVSNRTNDVDFYQQYLRARALVRTRGLKPLTDAADLLEQVVARDPNYAPAWALLAQAYNLTPGYHPAWDTGCVDELRLIVDATVSRADTAARRAIELDKKSADGYVSLGMAQAVRGKLTVAEDSFKHALALDPVNPDALHFHSSVLTEVGRLKEALAIRQRLQALEPFVPVFNEQTAFVLWLNGQNDAAITMYKALPPESRSKLADIYASMGRYRDAADALLTLPWPHPETLTAAARLLRTAPVTADSPQTLPRLGAQSFAYLYIGAPNRVLDFYEGNIELGYAVPASIALLWQHAYADLRKTERFKKLVRDAGLVDYWRARGWSDFCRPVGADDFVCE